MDTIASVVRCARLFQYALIGLEFIFFLFQDSVLINFLPMGGSIDDKVSVQLLLRN